MRIVDGRPIVEATIHGLRPFRLVVDTGFAGKMALSKDAADRIGLTRSGTMRVGDPSGRNAMDVEVYAINEVRLCGIAFHAVTASALPPSRSSAAVGGVVGIGLPTRGPAREIGVARRVSQEIPIMAVDLAAPVRVGQTRLEVSGITYPSPAPRGNVGSPGFAGMVLQIDLPHGLARVTTSVPERP